MVVIFGLWGTFGFLGSIVLALTLLNPNGVGVGTSSWICAAELIWIGNLIFFGILAATNAIVKALRETRQ